MESYEDILKRMEEAYERESGHRAEDVSDTGLRLKVLAGELYRLRAEIAWVARQAFPDTAAGEWLDRHGDQRGVPRREAESAAGKITFTRYLPLSFDLTIPKGTVCASSGESPVEYETTEDRVLAAGELSVEAPARAVVSGAAGNAAAGVINTLVSPVTGINYISNRSAFTGGREREGDEDYRPRVLAAYGDLPNGTNSAFYRDAALRWEGISAAGVVPRENGAGTVGVYVWGRGAAPSDEVLRGLSAEFERRREIGVTVTVRAATVKEVNVTARLQFLPGTDGAKACADVKSALERYFAGLSVGSPVYVSELQRAALNAAPVVRAEWGSTLRDVAASPSVLPTAGTITVEELTE